MKTMMISGVAGWRSATRLATIAALAAGLAACTTPQEQQALNEFKTLCSSIEPAASIVVAVTSNVGLGWASVPISGGAAIAAGVCSATETIVENTIDKINSLNGTASVSITQTGGNTAALEAFAAKYRGVASPIHRSTSLRGGRRTVTWTFTVPPHGGL